MQASRIARVAVVVAAILPGAGASGQDFSGVQNTSDPSVVRDCLITSKLIDVPAQEQGVLVEIKVRGNQQVKRGDILAQIDERQAKAAKDVADFKLAAAQKEAENQISVDYARAKWKVARTALAMAEDANTRVRGTHPELEILKLKLEQVSSQLETEHAEYQLDIARTNVGVRKAELVAADIDVERRKVIAPWDGEVIKRQREEGEWVKPGDPVVQLVQMDRLQIKAALDGSRLSRADVNGRAVSVRVVLPRGKEATFDGIIDDVSPVDEAGRRFDVTVDVVNRQENGYWLLHPGMKAEMTILKK